MEEKKHRTPSWLSRKERWAAKSAGPTKRGVMSNGAQIQLSGNAYQMCREEHGKTGVDLVHTRVKLV